MRQRPALFTLALLAGVACDPPVNTAPEIGVPGWETIRDEFVWPPADNPELWIGSFPVFVDDDEQAEIYAWVTARPTDDEDAEEIVIAQGWFHHRDRNPVPFDDDDTDALQWDTGEDAEPAERLLGQYPVLGQTGFDLLPRFPSPGKWTLRAWVTDGPNTTMWSIPNPEPNISEPIESIDVVVQAEPPPGGVVFSMITSPDGPVTPLIWPDQVGRVNLQRTARNGGQWDVFVTANVGDPPSRFGTSVTRALFWDEVNNVGSSDSVFFVGQTSGGGGTPKWNGVEVVPANLVSVRADHGERVNITANACVPQPDPDAEPLCTLYTHPIQMRTRPVGPLSSQVETEIDLPRPGSRAVTCTWPQPDGATDADNNAYEWDVTLRCSTSGVNPVACPSGDIGSTLPSNAEEERTATFNNVPVDVGQSWACVIAARSAFYDSAIPSSGSPDAVGDAVPIALATLAEPSAVTVAFSGSNLSCSWGAVPNATRYAVEWTCEETVGCDVPDPSSQTATIATLPYQTVARHGDTFTCHVQAFGDGAASAPAQSAPFYANQLPGGVTNLSAMLVEGRPMCTWNAPSDDGPGVLEHQVTWTCEGSGCPSPPTPEPWSTGTSQALSALITPAFGEIWTCAVNTRDALDESDQAPPSQSVTIE